jgi:hypothetical protein
VNRRTCAVSFDHNGGMYSHVTVAAAVFEAARNALQFWSDEFWRDPRPSSETVLQVCVTGTNRRYRVRAGRVLNPSG